MLLHSLQKMSNQHYMVCMLNFVHVVSCTITSRYLDTICTRPILPIYNRPDYAMLVCMYTCMHAFIYVRIYVRTYVRMWTCMNVCMYVVHNYTCCYSIPTKLLFTGPKPSARLVRTTDSSIMVSCSVPPQLQFANILNEWKVTLQRVGFPRTSVTTLFTAPNTQLTVNHLLPATRYTVWVSVRAGSAEGPLSDGFYVTTQEGGKSSC